MTQHAFEEMPEWADVPIDARSEILRMQKELTQGIAIAKDRRCGREKRDADGFYGLPTLEESLLTMNPGSARTAALARIEKLKAKLANDETEMESRDEMFADLQQHVAGRGMQPHEYLGQCVELEKTLQADLVGGIFKILEMRGIDPLQWIQMMKVGHRYDIALKLLDAVDRPERRTLN